LHVNEGKGELGSFSHRTCEDDNSNCNENLEKDENLESIDASAHHVEEDAHNVAETIRAEEKCFFLKKEIL